jgi:hypothetical protein
LGVNDIGHYLQPARSRIYRGVRATRRSRGSTRASAHRGTSSIYCRLPTSALPVSGGLLHATPVHFPNPDAPDGVFSLLPLFPLFLLFAASCLESVAVKTTRESHLAKAGPIGAREAMSSLRHVSRAPYTGLRISLRNSIIDSGARHSVSPETKRQPAAKVSSCQRLNPCSNPAHDENSYLSGSERCLRQECTGFEKL